VSYFILSSDDEIINANNPMDRTYSTHAVDGKCLHMNIAQKFERKIYIGGPRSKWQDNIKMNPKKAGYKYVN
jgi:hypothetical protein